MLNARLAGGHLYGKLLFTWLSLVKFMMVSFCAVLFPRRVLDDIKDIIESVSESFPTYSSIYLLLKPKENRQHLKQASEKGTYLCLRLVLHAIKIQTYRLFNSIACHSVVVYTQACEILFHHAKNATVGGRRLHEVNKSFCLWNDCVFNFFIFFFAT